MTDMSPIEEAQDPSTSAHRLAELAAGQPETQEWVARHPNAYDDLLEWLHTYGTVEAKVAVEQRPSQIPTADQTKVLAGAGTPDTVVPDTAAPGTAASDASAPASAGGFSGSGAASPASGPPVIASPTSSAAYPVSDKKYMTAVFLMLFFGGYGADRFYLGRIGTGVLKLVTLGFGGLWTMIDGLRIANGSLRATDELELDGFREHHRLVQVIVWILAGIYFLSIGLAIGFLIWVFAQAGAASSGVSEYSTSSESDGSGTDGSTAVDDGTDSELDDGYYTADGEYEAGSDLGSDGAGPAQGSQEDSPDSADEDDVGDTDQLLLDAAGYCPSGYDAQAYGETDSAFFVICTDGIDLVYYGESYRLGTGITLSAYETGDGYEATNYEDGVTTVYSVSEYSLTITNQDTGTVALDETVFNWAEDPSVGY
ncbi:TM2 domain-containing protein [Brevibacterium spongiae]|uniref:TM2 domain-containing protein n=1 Tax=Brevibacterium spongiae TaxID=2909672 RepID=A0ABY5ST66_9MICO|nr:TM2 domain-containing protein [Brevibacterium spongiae]UVI36348.1 TM2 domain-containing protein [Brevibacterium spongiae]